jgi:hypothetical protein
MAAKEDPTAATAEAAAVLVDMPGTAAMVDGHFKRPVIEQLGPVYPDPAAAVAAAALVEITLAPPVAAWEFMAKVVMVLAVLKMNYLTVTAKR